MTKKNKPPKSFDRQSYYRTLPRHGSAPNPPGHLQRRVFLTTFAATFGFSMTAMAAWPRRLAEIDSRRLRFIADIQENIRSSDTVALVRRPGSKPAIPLPGSGVATEMVASAAEMAEMEDGESSVQGPALSAEQMELAGNLNAVANLEEGEELIARLANPLDDAINRLMLGPGAVVGGPHPDGETPLGSALADLVQRSKPQAPAPEPVALPVKPRVKGRAPLSLASLLSPEDASSGGRKAATDSSGRREEAPRRSNPVGSTNRSLTLYNIHTGDNLTAQYLRDGEYVQSELKRLNWLLRDRRTGEIKRIDPALFDALYETAERIGARNRTINVLSGYRSPKTNAMLRENSSGVAQNSYHLLGRAIDFNIPGFQLAGLHKHALQTNAGGVGYYPSSDFIHMDTGPIRSWPAKYNYIAQRYQRPA